MAKELKAIKCPQCGSTEKTELKTDFYRCNNCQTEYFLDDNDITVNYNHNYNHNNLSSSYKAGDKSLSGLKIALFVVIAVIAAITIVTTIFTHDSAINGSLGSVVSNGSTLSGIDAGRPEFDASRSQSSLITVPGSATPVLAIIEKRDYNADKDEVKDGIYFTCYDPIQKKMINEQKIGDKNLEAYKFESRVFSDGNTYIISPSNTLYVIDKKTLTLIDAGEQFFTAQPKLQVGVATIKFVSDDYGDGLILMTNNGKNLFYYPLVQKLYTEDDFYDAKTGFGTLLPGAREKTYHVFTRESDDYPEELIQLLTISYKDNGGGPKDVEDGPRWGKDYGGSGIFTERDPYEKVLIGDYNKKTNRITNWKDLTPGRMYFSPDVMIDEKDLLIIKFRPDANPKSGFKLQQLDTKTGAVEWTAALPDTSNVRSLVKYKNGFLGVISNDETVLFDQKGSIKDDYKIK